MSEPINHDARLELTCRALGHVLGVSPDQLRYDSPLADIGADSIALLAFADVVEAFAGQASLVDFAVEQPGLVSAQNVGQLAEALWWRA